MPLIVVGHILKLTKLLNVVSVGVICKGVSVELNINENACAWDDKF